MSDKPSVINRLLGIGGMICAVLLLISIVFYALQSASGVSLVIGGHTFSLKNVLSLRKKPLNTSTPEWIEFKKTTFIY